MTVIDGVPADMTAPQPAGPDVEAAFASIIERLRHQPVEAALYRCQAFQRRLDTVEAELLAARLRSGSSESDTDKAAGRGNARSKTEAKKRTRRAKTLNENPTLGDDLDNGDLTPEQLDAIATASDKSDGDAARDDQLIDRVKHSNPDQARDIVKTWLDDHTGDKKTTEDEHQRRRRLRKVSTFTTARGTQALMAEGDKTTIDEMWKTIEAIADGLYRTDGGRDVAAQAHVRTCDQRRYDALHSLITRPAGNGSPNRATIVAVAGVDALSGSGEKPATLIGSGPLPQSVLERLACNADLIGTVYGVDGDPLWQGRRVRMVTRAQWVALVARDRGCVLCGADAQHCEAHHLIPWNAPARGRTDIDNLALLCGGCHHHVHDTRQTLSRDPSSHSWILRPATPDETPPPRCNPPP